MRPDLRGRGWIMFFFFFTTLFSGGLIPTYLVVRDLGLLNTRWALILPAALSVWNVIITRTYFQATIPGELLDAARIDGASDFRFLRDVVLPLSGPIVAVNALTLKRLHLPRAQDQQERPGGPVPSRPQQATA